MFIHPHYASDFAREHRRQMVADARRCRPQGPGSLNRIARRAVVALAGLRVPVARTSGGPAGLPPASR